VNGWVDMEVGHVADIVNNQKMIIAEIKNKHNTTKGSDKVRIYDGLAGLLGKKEYRDYKAYYVEIIPKGAIRYDMPFVPPDNTTRTRRVANDNIRQIDGYSFYELATGEKDALKKLYKALPAAIAQCCQDLQEENVYFQQNVEFDVEFEKLFFKAFGVDKG